MRFYTNPHPVYGGIDLPARSMDVCLFSQAGEMLLHRTMHAAPEPFLQAIAPYRAGLVVAVAGLLTWDWLADLGAQAGMPCVLGHALSMQAMHGGQVKNDTSDSPNIAARRRGGLLPPASVSPAEMRAPRDLLRRRTPRRRQRAELLAPVHKTHAHYTVPDIGKKSAYKAHRAGVAARFADPAVPKTLEVDLALITSDDQLLSALELFSLKTAKQPEAQTRYLLQTVPGLGTILRRVWLYAMHQIERCPRVQDVASYGRRVKYAQASGGTRVGTSGQKIGNAPLQWAFSEAATLFLRGNAPGQKSLARWEQKQDQGNALRILAHQLARAVSCMLKRKTAVDLEHVLRPSESRAGEPGAALDPEGRSLHRTDVQPMRAASVNAEGRRGPLSLRPALGLDTRSGSGLGGV